MNQNPLSETQSNISPEQLESEPLVSNIRSTNWSKTLLFVVLGLIVIAGAVYGGFYIGKKQVANEELTTVQEEKINNPVATITSITTVDPTEGWEIYQNYTFGFSFKYPNQLTQLSEPTRKTVSPSDNTLVEFSQDISHDILDSEAIQQIGYSKLVLHIQFNNKPSFDQLIKTSQSNPTPIKYQVGNLKILKHIGFYKNEPTAYYSVIKNNKIISIGLVNSTATSQVSNATLDKILSTFEFVEDDGSKIVNWEIYNSPEIGSNIYPFEISYPSNWTIDEKLTSEESKSLVLTLVNHNQEMIQIIQGDGGGGSCIYYDDSDYMTFEGMGQFFSAYTELNQPAIWRISQFRDGNEKSHVVCEKSKNRYINGTKIGWININVKSESSLQEAQTILQKIILKPTANTSTLFD